MKNSIKNLNSNYSYKIRNLELKKKIKNKVGTEFKMRSAWASSNAINIRTAFNLGNPIFQLYPKLE